MCISPSEMTTQQLEQEIAACWRWSNEARTEGRRLFFKARAENLERLLKERAEEGTY